MTYSGSSSIKGRGTATAAQIDAWMQAMGRQLTGLLRPMESRVFSARHHLKVLRAIVAPIPVDVVNNFIALQRPSEHSSRHEAMLVNPSTGWVINHNIAHCHTSRASVVRRALQTIRLMPTRARAIFRAVGVGRLHPINPPTYGANLLRTLFGTITRISALARTIFRGRRSTQHHIERLAADEAVLENTARRMGHRVISRHDSREVRGEGQSGNCRFGVVHEAMPIPIGILP